MDLLKASWKDIREGVKVGNIRACVVGLGYVGLPLAIILAERGFVVTGVDINTSVIEKCKEGGTHLYENGLSSRLLSLIEKGMIDFSTDASSGTRQCDVIFVTVGTPLGTDKKIDASALKQVAVAVGRGLERGKLVILKSTVTLGGARQIVKPILEEESGLVAEQDFGLAFVPERTVEGNSLKEVVSLPKIVAGLGDKSRKAAQRIYRMIGGPIVPVSCLEVAEAAKVFDNIYRDVNIALANELAVVCEQAGVDAVEAINAANLKYFRTNILTPGVGVGGSCLTKDPYIMAQVSAGNNGNGNSSLIMKARQVNDSMPQHFVNLVKEAFIEMNKTLAGSHVAVLGYAMKAGTNDTRKTPVKQLIERLKQEKVEVSVYDPFVSPEEIQVELGIRNASSLLDAVHSADAVCIVTDHDEFSNIDLAKLKSYCAEPCAIIDGRHVIEPREAQSHGFVFRGVGRPHQYAGVN